jgi:hypothetical protein
MADCQLIDEMVEQEKMSNIFTTEAKLFPPDITRLVEAKHDLKEKDKLVAAALPVFLKF